MIFVVELGHSSGAQELLLPLHSETTPGITWDTIWDAGNKIGPAACKVSSIVLEIPNCHWYFMTNSFYYYNGLKHINFSLFLGPGISILVGSGEQYGVSKIITKVVLSPYMYLVVRQSSYLSNPSYVKLW